MGDNFFDEAVFSELRNSAGGDFARELAHTFFEEAPGMLADLRSARGTGDGDRFRRAAHSLKSNADTFGARKLAALAREIELRGLDADAARDMAALAALEAEYARAAAQLKVMCNG
jgi:histidine phosphotransfer protein HptB